MRRPDLLSLVLRLPRGALARGAGLSLAVKAAAMPATLLLQWGLVRLLAPAGYGDFIYAYTWFTALLPLAALGLHEATVAHVARFRTAGQPALLAGYVRWSVRQAAASAATVAAIGLLLVVALRERLGATLSWTLAALAVALVPGALAVLAAMRLRAAERFAAAQIPQQLGLPLGIVGLTWLAVEAGGIPAVAPTAAAATLVTVGGLLAVVHGLASSVAPADPQPTSREQRRGWQRAAWHFTGLALIAALARVDVLMLGWLEGTVEAGIYATALNLAVLGEVGFNTLAIVTGARMASLHARGARRELQEMLRLSVGGSAVVAVAAGAALLVVGRPVLALFDASFVAGYPALVALVAFVLANVLTGPVGQLLAMSGDERWLLRLTAAGMALNVALNAVLIPLLGSVGAALATCAATVAWKGVGLLRVRRILGVDPTVASWLRRAR